MTASPRQVAQDPCPQNTDLQVAVVMARAAEELNVIVQHCADLEEGLLSFLPSSNSTEARVALQSLDLIQQSLDNMSNFLAAAAEQTDGGRIDLAPPLSGVTLGDMRARLSGTPIKDELDPRPIGSLL